MAEQAVEIRFARETESPLVSSVLVEAAAWIAERRAPLWPREQLGADAIAADVRAGRYVLMVAGNEAVGTARLTLDDPECWPDAVSGVAVYVHRIAIRRAWAGRSLPGMLLAWCEQQAQALARGYLRLDCDATRPKLRRLYEELGFRFHSKQCVGQYTVARYERVVP